MKENISHSLSINSLPKETAIAFREMEERGKRINKMMLKCMQKPITLRSKNKKISFLDRIWTRRHI